MGRPETATVRHRILSQSDHFSSNGIEKGNHKEQKIFLTRESPLTELMDSPHIRAIYHIFIVILCVLCLNTFIYDLVDSGKINLGMGTVAAGFGDIGRALKIWLAELSLALAVYPGLRVFAAGHKLLHKYQAVRKLWKVFWLLATIALQAILLILPLSALARQHLAIASGIAVTCELFRFGMKIHAMLCEVVPRVLATSSTSPAVPTFGHYVYFLFVPTLLYRDTYPRTKSIRWSKVVVHLLEVLGTMFYNCFLWERFILPYWSDFGKSSEVEAGKVVLGIFACVLPGILSFLCGFYCLLHAWLNAFAELLTFADRLFYEPWWTTSRFSTFYRTWNRVVHVWLHDYVHTPLSSFIGRNMASLTVFLVSAIAHEVILALSYGFFYPVLLVMFLSNGLIVVPLTSQLGRSYPKVMNLFMWLGFFIGNGLLWSLYPMEFFARKNCPPSENDSFFIPKSWSCPKIILRPDWQFQNPFID